MCIRDSHYPYSLPNNSVWSIFPDPDGGIWVGTYGGKLAYMTFADNGVDYFKDVYKRQSSSSASSTSAYVKNPSSSPPC